MIVLAFLVFLFVMERTTFAVEENTFGTILKDTGVIAHALGEVNGHRHTNSLEAFQTSYKNGIRVFEVDLILTSDQHLVARHDWQPYLARMFEQSLPTNGIQPLTLEEFQNHKINKRLHPLTVEDIISLLQIYPDAYIITDTKSTDLDEIKTQFSVLLQTIFEIDPTMINRVIPQVYNEEMFALLIEMYPFEHFVYTLYKTFQSSKEVIDFVVRENIQFVAMSESKYSKEFIHELTDRGITSMIYTINDQDLAESYFQQGVTAVYTDQLLPNRKE
ncbi:phosphatidylinositol-specific phospholipase C/glycerophosphodiester phosphodiesterase family protein [Robertmurraya sp. 2P01SA]|uniref:phosphatidylinositol-specific phospholipase C/glycerophosphodiester phosphodiesterase family protein n=2 Tax=Robertmurraya TaxID=2837507 RepID=UPI0039A541B9